MLFLTHITIYLLIRHSLFSILFDSLSHIPYVLVKMLKVWESNTQSLSAIELVFLEETGDNHHFARNVCLDLNSHIESNDSRGRCILRNVMRPSEKKIRFCISLAKKQFKRLCVNLIIVMCLSHYRALC